MKQVTEKEVFFCSAASRYFKEQLAGTASNCSTFILVEYSNPFPQKVTDTTINQDWLKKLQSLARSLNGKLVLIRNRKSNFKDCKIIFVDCKRCAYFIIHSTVDTCHSIRLQDYIDAPDVRWQNDPFFVICTNGKKDKCCAKFGFPVFKFFESFNADVSVWESSHLGGDRFAANVVAMPFGIYYGHVAVEDVGHIMVRTLLRKIYKNKYRGLSLRSFFDQSVECYLREYLQNYDIDFDISIHILKEAENMSTVKITTKNNGNFLMQLLREVVPYPHLLTCTSKKAEDLKKYKLVKIEQVHI